MDKIWVLIDEYDSSSNPRISLYHSLAGAIAGAQSIVREAYDYAGADEHTSLRDDVIADVGEWSDVGKTRVVEYCTEQWIALEQHDVND